MHSAAQLTRSSWAPTISLDSQQNIMLHPSSRVNAVFLTYLRTHQIWYQQTYTYLVLYISRIETNTNCWITVLEDATLTTLKLLPII